MKSGGADKRYSSISPCSKFFLTSPSARRVLSLACLSVLPFLTLELTLVKPSHPMVHKGAFSHVRINLGRAKSPHGAQRYSTLEIDKKVELLLSFAD